MGMFTIQKTTTGNFYHIFNNESTKVNLSDFEVVLDDADATFIIQCKNGANIPYKPQSITELQVINLNIGTSPIPFSGVDGLRELLTSMNYTPYVTSGGGGGIQSIVAGTNITVDDSDPQNPIVSASGGGGSNTLQEVLTEGNNADNTIELENSTNITTIEQGSIYTKNKASTAGVGFSEQGIDIYTQNESLAVGIKTDNITETYFAQLPNKIGGAEETFAMVSDIPDVADYLPLAGGTMDVGAEISFDNTSKLAEGSFDSGTGGANGISLFCDLGYEWNFQAGEGYLVRLSDNKIQVKEYARSVPTATDDSSKGFEVGSVWNMVDHNVDYVCTDPTVGAAVWQAKEYTFDPAIADINYVRNGITGWIEAYSKAQVDALLTAVARTGAVVAFDVDAVYNSIASPSSSNLTDDLTGARLKIVQKIYHNAGTAPTVPAGWVRRGTGTYVTSTLNIIYAEWSVGTTVEYWITQ